MLFLESVYHDMGYFRSISLLIGLALFSCNDDVDKHNHPIYVIADNVYSFRPSENEITGTLDLGVNPYLNVRSGNELFIHSYPYQAFPLSLHVVDLHTLSIKRSKQYGPPSGEASAMAVADKIFIYDSDYTQGGAFISTLNPESLEAEDTVFTNTPSYAQDLRVVGNKIFLSLGTEIKVLNAATLDEIKTFDISSPIFPYDYYSKFILDKDNNILIYNGGLRKLSSDDLTMKALRKHDTSIYWPIKRPAYNAAEEVLYILTETIESGETTYPVRKFNLNTMEEEDFITDPATLSLQIEFISYNSDNRLIIIGGRNSAGGIVKTFNTAGVFQKEYTIPSTPSNAY